MTLDALSIAMLLMPPKNRRWIQLLLRFIDRVSSNYCLKLDRFKSISNRALLINALSCCFVYPPVSVLHSDGVRLLSCLLDLQAEIFKPPVGLENRVKAKLLQTRCTAPRKVFCEQVSVEEYRRQAMANSMDAVLQLLEDIVQDECMSREDKTKRLRDFQMTYPILYQQRFPNDPMPSKKESFFGQLKEKFGFTHTRL